MNGGSERIEELAQEMGDLAAQYAPGGNETGQAAAESRQATGEAGHRNLGTLAMAQCQLEIALTPREDSSPHPHGSEDIEFLISTNPGAPPSRWAKLPPVASCRASAWRYRWSLPASGTVPSMVFDEVDVGIGGAVAEVVGKLLRDLAGRAQVLCVTHLPRWQRRGISTCRSARQQRKISANRPGIAG